MKNKQFDPFQNLILSPYEQEIEDNLDHAVSIPNLEEEKKRYAQMAKNTLEQLERQKNKSIQTDALVDERISAAP